MAVEGLDVAGRDLQRSGRVGEGFLVRLEVEPALCSVLEEDSGLRVGRGAKGEGAGVTFGGLGVSLLLEVVIPFCFGGHGSFQVGGGRHDENRVSRGKLVNDRLYEYLMQYNMTDASLPTAIDAESQGRDQGGTRCTAGGGFIWNLCLALNRVSLAICGCACVVAHRS